MISSNIAFRIIRPLEELEDVLICGERYKNHPDVDIDHIKLICRLRKGEVTPDVTVIEPDSQPSFLLVGRIEQTLLVSSIGYYKLVGIQVKVLLS